MTIKYGSIEQPRRKTAIEQRQARVLQLVCDGADRKTIWEVMAKEGWDDASPRTLNRDISLAYKTIEKAKAGTDAKSIYAMKVTELNQLKEDIRHRGGVNMTRDLINVMKEEHNLLRLFIPKLLIAGKEFDLSPAAQADLPIYAELMSMLSQKHASSWPNADPADRALAYLSCLIDEEEFDDPPCVIEWLRRHREKQKPGFDENDYLLAATPANIEEETPDENAS